MNETQEEIIHIDKPDWLELPEEEKLRHVYWTAMGWGLKTRKPFWARFLKSHKLPIWCHLFPSKEEAEAYASRPNLTWKWDGDPANRCSLQQIMSEARRDGHAGVAITGFRHGRWVTLKEYPADVPLSSED